MPIIGVPVAWTPAQRRPHRRGHSRHAPCNAADLEKFGGKLKGKIVLITAVPYLAVSVKRLSPPATPAPLPTMATELIPVAR